MPAPQPTRQRSSRISSDCADDPELAGYLQFAQRLADEAAPLSLQYFRQQADTESLDLQNKLTDGRFDPVTVADRSIERRLRELITEHYPQHGIIGEEFGVRESRGGWSWVLDPIDGTRAYISGLPLWGTLIALQRDGEPVLGLCDQPFLAERYLAGPQRTVCIDRAADRSLSTTACEHLDQAVMMTTDPSMFTMETEIQAFESLRQATRMSRFGGDCYAYCLLASGFIDLVVEADLQSYDIQALIPIVQSAGGKISNWHGQSAAAGGQVIAAANAALHAAALELLAAGASD